jgi:hypothetical protein
MYIEQLKGFLHAAITLWESATRSPFSFFTVLQAAMAFLILIIATY